MADGGEKAIPNDNPDFNGMRAEAQSVLDALQAPQGDIGTMDGMNLEQARTRAWATWDCWSPKWLRRAFEEVDRLLMWYNLRQRQVQAVLDLHIPVDVDQVYGPMEANWLAPLICGECQVPFPCKTRTSMLDIERDLTK